MVRVVTKWSYKKICQKLFCPVGATGVEYALIAALIAAVIVSIVAVLGGQVLEYFERVPPF